MEKHDEDLISYYEKKLEGKTCPWCKSTEIACISYGLPERTPAVDLLVARKKLFWGGCVVRGDQDDLLCWKCDRSFKSEKKGMGFMGRD